MTTGRPVAKTIIKYNSNSKDENDEEEKGPIDIKFTEQKDDSEIMKILLTLDYRMYKKKTRKILLWLTSFKSKKKTVEENFSKK